MKPFNLEEYLKNPSRKVVTKDGGNVRIICTDAKGDFPIIALIETLDGSIEFPHKFKKNGHFLYDNEDYHLNLFFAPEKKEGWVNVFKTDIDMFKSGRIYNSETEAKESVVCDEKYVDTVKIEWEE